MVTYSLFFLQQKYAKLLLITTFTATKSKPSTIKEFFKFRLIFV